MKVIRTGTGQPEITCQNLGCYHAASGRLNRGRRDNPEAGKGNQYIRLSQSVPGKVRKDVCKKQQAPELAFPFHVEWKLEVTNRVRRVAAGSERPESIRCQL